MLRLKLISSLGFILLFICNCGKSSNILNIFSPEPGAIYYNSFEKEGDFRRIEGYGWEIQKEAPAHGGLQSLMVSGGCIAPHASIELPLQSEDGYYKLQCWGKNLAFGGGLTLAINGSWEHSIHLNISESDWQFIESTDSLYCPANKRMVLQLFSGGIVASAMLVDMVEVVSVK